MRIALFGAGGTIGQRIAREALDRGHEVTAVVREPDRFQSPDPRLRVTRGDVLDAGSIAAAVRGHDAVISAVGPGHGGSQSPAMLAQAARELLEGVRRAGVHRLLVVGGAGSLETAPGVQLLDSPSFPAAWKPLALAHRDALQVYRSSGATGVDWTYFSPADLIQPGPRTGRYRTGTDQLVVNTAGRSEISAEDFAVAVLDELEHPANLRRRMTVAY
jgi:putative NADH-flavin reductase